MISDGETIKTKMVDLKNLYNFIADNLFIWNDLSNENYVWILIFEIWIFKRPRMEKQPRQKL